MRLLTRMRALIGLLLLPALGLAEVYVPKDLEGWQGWVLDGHEYLRCPFFAGTPGGDRQQRVCMLPGRLSLDLTGAGGKFSQSWIAYTPGWIHLPGSFEAWPGAVTINGAPAAVVAHDQVPSIHVSAGVFAVSGQFLWSERPESLRVPEATALISLGVDGKKIEQFDRNANEIELGRHREATAAREIGVQVYRLLSDGIPLELYTRLILRITGDPREETLPPVLPAGFTPMSIDSELPARLSADGRLHIQARPGSYSVGLHARGGEDIRDIKLPEAQGLAPKEEIWSYSSDARLRVASLEGGESVDPAQVEVPDNWRNYPSYRLAAGQALHLIEQSRSTPQQQANHLILHRTLYLDFSHAGYTVVDAISGEMRTGWRLEMRRPFALASASQGKDGLLITAGSSDSTGVEIRSPVLHDLTAVSRLPADAAQPATGWNQRFDRVEGSLILPPGHRLLAVLGADHAGSGWIEEWRLFDLFLVLLLTAVTYRHAGARFAALALLTGALIHHESARLLWLLLLALLGGIAVNKLSGRLLLVARSLSALALAALIVCEVPFCIEQARFALYPQLADRALVEASYQTVALSPPPAQLREDEPARLASAAPAAAVRDKQKIEVTADAGESTVENPYGLKALVVENPYGLASLLERYAPGTMVQVGPGRPQWTYGGHAYGWSGAVEEGDRVHFLILSPWLVTLWRLLGIALLITLTVRAARDHLDPSRLSGWLRGPPTRMTAALMIFTLCALNGAPSVSRAAAPDSALLKELEARLSRPADCVPSCAEIMNARIAVNGAGYEISLDVAALGEVAVPMPTLGQRMEPDAISIDGAMVPGAYRDTKQGLWLIVKPGVHAVRIGGRFTSDAVSILFAQQPRRASVSAPGWEASGIGAGKLLGNTLQLTRQQHEARGEQLDAGAERFAPFVRVRRIFRLGLDWSVNTVVTRLAPEHGGFTLEIPLVAGESVLTGGINTNGQSRVPASFDSSAQEFVWTSALAMSDQLSLSAPRDKPWREVWDFQIGPVWRAQFEGTPAVPPEPMPRDAWVYEYYPRAGETLHLKVSRPAAVPGNTLAIDDAQLSLEQGARTRTLGLTFNYRSTRGNSHSLTLPASAEVTSVRLDQQSQPLHVEHGRLQLAIAPGIHKVAIEWRSNDATGFLTRPPRVDLGNAASNVSMRIDVGPRWVLFAGGSGVGPAILYWGELVVFIVLAFFLGRSPRSRLRMRDWLFLGLGLSTYSWTVLLLFAAWMFALSWRGELQASGVRRAWFNLLQVGLIAFSVATLLALVGAIPYGLLGTPDMRIDGYDSQFSSLSWFSDRVDGVLPTPWVISVSLWWYKLAMLTWALWLAFALTRWVPMAWAALNAGGLWRPRAPRALQSSPPASAQ